MAGIRTKRCGGGQVGGVRVESGWGRKRDTHRSCVLAISPYSLALISRSMLSVKSAVIVGAYVGIMSSPLTRSGGPQQSGRLGFNRNGRGRERTLYGVKKETELSVRAKEIVDAAFFLALSAFTITRPIHQCNVHLRSLTIPHSFTRILSPLA